MTHCLFAAVCSLVLCTAAHAGTTWYASPNGTGDGLTANTPFSVSDANSDADEGDTVYFLEGEYHGRVQPVRSGALGLPIVFADYPGDAGAPVFAPGVDDKPCFLLKDVSFIHLRGLDCDGSITTLTVPQGALLLGDTHDNVLEDCVIENVTKVGVELRGVDKNIVRRCIIRDVGENGTNVGETLKIKDSDNNLIEGNCIERGGHNVVQIVDSASNVLRRNDIRNPWTRVGTIIGPTSTRNVLEDNIITEGSNGEDAIPNDVPWKAWKLAAPQNVIRGNRIYGNRYEGSDVPAPPLHPAGIESPAKAGSVQPDVSKNRLYHNVFYDNALQAFRVFSVNAAATDADDIRATNNVFFANHDGAEDQIEFDLDVGDPDFDGAAFNANVIRNSAAGDEVVSLRGVGHSLSSIESSHAANFFDNTEDDPKFRDTAASDFRLRADSSLIDAGAFLAETTAAGTTTMTVPVTDPLVFVGGADYTLTEVGGDLIQIGATPVEVVSIDATAGTIQVDTDVTFGSGAGVSLAYHGNAPDIGALAWTLAFDEDFETYTSGTDPTNPGEGNTDDWHVSETQESAIAVSGSGGAQLLAVDQTTTDSWLVRRDFDVQGRNTVVQRMKIRFTDLSLDTRALLFLTDSGSQVSWIEFDADDEKIFARSAGSPSTHDLVDPLLEDTWYEIEVVLDLAAEEYDARVLVDGQQVGTARTGLDFVNSGSTVDRLIFKGSPGRGAAELEIDDVEIEVLSEKPTAASPAVSCPAS